MKTKPEKVSRIVSIGYLFLCSVAAQFAFLPVNIESKVAVISLAFSIGGLNMAAEYMVARTKNASAEWQNQRT